MQIWGIPKTLDEMTDDEILSWVDKWIQNINSVAKGIKYADHGAYSQDQRRIATLQDEIRKMKWFIENRQKIREQV